MSWVKLGPLIAPNRGIMTTNLRTIRSLRLLLVVLQSNTRASKADRIFLACNKFDWERTIFNFWFLRTHEVPNAGYQYLPIHVQDTWAFMDRSSQCCTCYASSIVIWELSVPHLFACMSHGHRFILSLSVASLRSISRSGRKLWGSGASQDWRFCFF